MIHYLSNWMEKSSETNLKMVSALLEQIKASQIHINGNLKYLNDFSTPFFIALNSFLSLEKIKLQEKPCRENIRDYNELLLFNKQITEKGTTSTIEAINRYHWQLLTGTFSSLMNTLHRNNGEGINTYALRQTKLVKKVVHDFPEAIKSIKPEYGFHLNQSGYKKTAETDRMLLYQVLPLDSQIKIKKKGKPIIIIPPYVLGANIIGFLPHEKKSYAHSFADQGIPTYIRILKDINTTPGVQTMSAEDDTLDTSIFCKIVKEKHGREVTLNGFCQGGFIAVINVLSGKLDNLVDALITCVAPMDGTRSKSLVEYMNHIPKRFRDLGYAVKTLPNGNQVVDGTVMSWVYKLKSMEREAPIFTFYRDLMMFDRPDGEDVQISKTAAAINYWLLYDKTDLPIAITKISFDSYTIPVTKNGTLPIKLFNRKLNFKRINEKGIKFLICYAEKDDLVDKDAALAPLDYIDAEVTVFPKGHGAIATSWSLPTSKCALHKKFGDNYRGPVRFQLDLQ